MKGAAKSFESEEATALKQRREFLLHVSVTSVHIAHEEGIICSLITIYTQCN